MLRFKCLTPEHTMKLEWLETLSRHCGIELWDAVFHESDATHPKARWTWSAEFRRLCGYSTEAEFPNVMQSWSDRLHPDDVGPTFEAFGSSCKTGCGYDVTYRLKVRDGTYQWFRATGGVALDANSKAHRAYGSLVNIQDYKAPEHGRAAALGQLADTVESSIGQMVDRISETASNLETVSGQMTGLAGETRARASDVASAAMQASTNVHTVASAAEELSVSIREITGQVERSSSICSRAEMDARQTDAIVGVLAANAQKIGEVVALIAGIALQTNLLALNATIEAVSEQIQAIQKATSEAVAAISGIVGTISEVSTISDSRARSCWASRRPTVS